MYWFICVIGQVIASDYTGFSNLKLKRTDPPGVDIDVVQYNGTDFSVKNSFEIDQNPITSVSMVGVVDP